ncbi:MAG: HD domain-containing protein [Candidatus Cloacimonetes bacterium]|nr:HD domain-containing protein [Candidatus Cloacimonadota bacterium]
MVELKTHVTHVAVRTTQIPLYKETALYYRSDEGEWVLYKKPGEIISQHRLDTERIPRLFILTEDRESAAVEIQTSFNRILDESLGAGDVKTVHNCLVGIAVETLNEPRSGTMRQARRSVALLTRASTRDPAILKQITNLYHLDYTTALHSVNVMTLTLGFAHKVGYGWRRTLEFGLAALLHDIGKIQIPESLLKSPKPLTDDEFRIMRQHPIMALDVLDRAKMTLPKVRAAAIEHHERINGTGYPFGKTDISLVGQIVGIIDAYEALTNEDRPYRRAAPPGKALQILREETDRGYHMPSLYNRFLQSLSV